MIGFAAHRVYILSDGTTHVCHMVRLDSQHHVTTIQPFSHEVHHTIWLDGVIVVSPIPIHTILPNETISHLRSRYNASESNQEASLYAYHISHINYAEMRCTGESVATLL